MSYRSKSGFVWLYSGEALLSMGRQAVDLNIGLPENQKLLKQRHNRYPSMVQAISEQKGEDSGNTRDYGASQNIIPSLNILNNMACSSTNTSQGLLEIMSVWKLCRKHHIYLKSKTLSCSTTSRRISCVGRLLHNSIVGSI